MWREAGFFPLQINHVIKSPTGSYEIGPDCHFRSLMFSRARSEIHIVSGELCFRFEPAGPIRYLPRIELVHCMNLYLASGNTRITSTFHDASHDPSLIKTMKRKADPSGSLFGIEGGFELHQYGSRGSLCYKPESNAVAHRCHFSQ